MSFPDKRSNTLVDAYRNGLGVVGFRKIITVVASAGIVFLSAVVLLHGPPLKPPEFIEAPQSHPELFYQYHHDIRASSNGTVGYPMGYRTKEYEKALAHVATLGWTSTDLNWVERGPGNVGGRTRPIVMDPDDSSMLTWWAGAVSGGLWKTTNGGTSWKSVTDHLANLAVTCLAMAPGKTDVLYMGTGDGFGTRNAIGGDGIFKSTDRGKTWSHLTSTASNDDFRFVNRITVDPADEDIVLAATNEGIFRSTNGGSTWTEVYSGSRRVQDLRPQPGNFDRLVAGVDGLGVIYSNDAGVTWLLATHTFPIPIERVELAYSSLDSSIAYAAISDPLHNEAHLYRSNDGGVSWIMTLEKGGRSQNWLMRQGWHDNALAVHPFKPDTVVLGGVYLRWAYLDGKVLPRGPTHLDRGGTGSWLALADLGGSHFDGLVSYLDPKAEDVSADDYSTIEIRFGQGNQKAHRFTVAEDAGTHNNGGAGVPLEEYQYEDYLEVPFQVWDADNNLQLMVSFRDQADDSTFNLIEHFTSTESGTRDQQSYERLFIHRYEYDSTTPHDSIDVDGGMVHGMLYAMWPVLASGATWDPGNLSQQTLKIIYTPTDHILRQISSSIAQPHVDHHGLLTVPIDQSNFWILNTNDGGVSISKNGGTSFSEKDAANAGYNTTQPYGVAKKPGSRTYLIGTQDNGTWRSPNNPDSKKGWSNVVGGDGYETLWHATDSNKLMGTLYGTWVFRSLDGGYTFRTVRKEYPGGLFITPLASSDKKPNTVYTLSDKGLVRSTNFGGSWSTTAISKNWGAWYGGKVRVSQPDPKVVWVGFGIESASDGRRLHVSLDEGLTFSVTSAANVTRPPEARISGMATHPTKPGTAYALFSVYGHAKILETQDTGNTWVDLSSFNSSGNSTNGFPDVAVHDLLVMPHAPTVFWAGTDIGLFESRDSGANWSYTNNGLMAAAIWRMKFRDNEVIVATHGRGVWTVPAGDISTAVAEKSGTLPARFILSQNYPNPFNASTNIRFAVPTEAHVRLIVYDMLGRRVSVLTDQVYTPGTHDLTWNADAHASGIYFYRMESEGRLVGTQKMTLLK